MRGKMLCLAVAAGLICSCARKPREPAAPTTQPLTVPTVVSVGEDGSPTFVYQEVLSPDDLSATDDLRAMVDIVVITAPVGVISANGQFWAMTRAVTEAGQDSTLKANGIRVGVMKAQDWPEARGKLSEGSSTISQPIKFSGTARGSLPAGEFVGKTIFYFDANGQMHGRTFDESELSWGMHYSPDSQKPGMVRLDISPVVQSQRKQMRLTRTGQEVGIAYVQPEVSYDLGLHVSVPVGSAIAIAPTAQGVSEETSVGRAFLTEDTPGVRSERLLMVYPRLYRLESDRSRRERR